MVFRQLSFGFRRLRSEGILPLCTLWIDGPLILPVGAPWTPGWRRVLHNMTKIEPPTPVKFTCRHSTLSCAYYKAEKVRSTLPFWKSWLWNDLWGSKNNFIWRLKWYTIEFRWCWEISEFSKNRPSGLTTKILKLVNMKRMDIGSPNNYCVWRLKRYTIDIGWFWDISQFSKNRRTGLTMKMLMLVNIKCMALGNSNNYCVWMLKWYTIDFRWLWDISAFSKNRRTGLTTKMLKLVNIKCMALESSNNYFVWSLKWYIIDFGWF